MTRINKNTRLSYQKSYFELRKRKTNKTPFSKKLVIVCFVLLISSTLMYIFTLYQKIYTPNILFPSTSQEQFIYIPTGSHFNEVVEILNNTGLLMFLNNPPKANGCDAT